MLLDNTTRWLHRAKQNSLFWGIFLETSKLIYCHWPSSNQLFLQAHSCSHHTPQLLGKSDPFLRH